MPSQHTQPHSLSLKTHWFTLRDYLTELFLLLGGDDLAELRKPVHYSQDS